MRFVLLHSAREWSGAARALAVAAHGLAARGHSVTFAATPDSNVERIASRDAVMHGTPAYAVEPFSSAGTWLGAAWRLRRILRGRAIDTVVVDADRTHLIAATACILAGRGSVVRRVPAGHTLTMNRSGRFATTIRPTAFAFVNEGDARAAVLPRRALPPTIAPLGVDPAVYDAMPQSPSERDGIYIICISDDSSRARAAMAIRTVAMLAPRHPEIQLVIVGGYADDDDLRMQAAALDVLHLVSFLGERDDALYVMRNARLGWVVADADTAAFGILDLMALGVPVLAGDGTLAQRYVLPQITGALLPPEEPALAAATVAGLLSNDEQRTTMGHAARVRVAREFPESAMIDGVERAAAAAQGRRRSRP